MADQQYDERDQDFDGVEDADNLAEQADQNRPYGEVTAEDLSTDDLVADGADLATAMTASEPGADGPVPVDVAIPVDDPFTEETIEERLLQEEPDPNSAIQPPDANPLIQS